MFTTAYKMPWIYMYIWGQRNSLLLNVNKTKAMILGNRGKLNTLVDPAQRAIDK